MGVRGDLVITREVQVQAYSGYKVNERPLAFSLDGEQYKVSHVLDRWYEGGLSSRSQKLDYFKVQTDRGAEFILRYNYQFDCWSVLLPDTGDFNSCPGIRLETMMAYAHRRWRWQIVTFQSG